MQLIKIDQLKPDFSILKKISEEIKKGRLIVYPTDTLYGLCTNPFRLDCVEKIFEVKKRNFTKGLPILVDGLRSLKKIAVTNNKNQILIKKFWPGPLTIILPKKNLIPDMITGGGEKIAVRQPGSPLAIQLAKLMGGFLIGTSANISGSNNQPINSKIIIEELDEKIDFILDSGETLLKRPSTILDWTGQKPKIIREGAISKYLLNNFLDQYF